MKTYKITISDDGTIRWYNENGELHREGGPAVEYTNGTKIWYINGKLHREDGPAIEFTNGVKFWYLNGKECTNAEFNTKFKKQSCNGKIIEFEGKKYKLQAI